MRQMTFSNTSGSPKHTTGCVQSLASFTMALICAQSCLAADMHSSNFKGVNWADSRDNFVDGWIIPSGIDHRRCLPEVKVQAREILQQLQQLLKINTVRLGINPDTVLDATWWPKYQAIVEQCTELNIKVILACWESESNKNGRIDHQPSFDLMWSRVLRDFGDNQQVYFEIFNEPHGYSADDWQDLAIRWLEQHLGKIKEQDRARVIISGSGYNTDLAKIANDPRLAGCLLSFHWYAWFGGQHDSQLKWRREMEAQIGRANADRTIVTEWGAPMKTPAQDHYFAQSPDGDRQRSYLHATSSLIRDWNMGSIYWPGLRDGDDYSLTERVGATLALRVTNTSGRELLWQSFQATETDTRQPPR